MVVLISGKQANDHVRKHHQSRLWPENLHFTWWALLLFLCISWNLVRLTRGSELTWLSSWGFMPSVSSEIRNNAALRYSPWKEREHTFVTSGSAASFLSDWVLLSCGKWELMVPIPVFSLALELWPLWQQSKSSPAGISDSIPWGFCLSGRVRAVQLAG